MAVTKGQMCSAPAKWEEMVNLVGGRFAPLEQPARAGSGGEVRKAVDLESDGRFVAIKYLYSNHPDDPLSRLQFDREVSSLQQLQYPHPHPNIVELIWAGLDEHTNRRYLVLEWIETDLHSLLAEPPWEAWDDFAEAVALPLAKALSYAHLKGIQHRDIKPENVLVAADGTPKLADFGIAKRDNIVDQSGLTLYEAHTPPYAPPDNGLGAEFTRDVWAFAVLIIRSMHSEQLRTYPDVFSALQEVDLPSDIRSLLARCVDLDPSVRPANGAVLTRELAEIQGNRLARATRANSILWLGLTNTAHKAIAGSTKVDPVAAERQVLIDLSNRWYAKYDVDKRTGEADRHRIQLYGQEWQYIAKLDSEASKFILIGARRGHPDYHAKDVALAQELTSISAFSFRCVGNAIPAEAGARMLLAALEEHTDRTTKGNEDLARVGQENQYFEQLLELLDAQEELAQGDRRPLSYRTRRIRGREVDFELTSPIEAVLFGQTWDIRIGGRRRVGRGEIVRQGSQTLTLLISRNPRAIPERGELVPNLGATQVAHDRQIDAVRRIRDGKSLRPDLRELLVDPSRIRPPAPTIPANWIQTTWTKTSEMGLRRLWVRRTSYSSKGRPEQEKPRSLPRRSPSSLRPIPHPKR